MHFWPPSAAGTVDAGGVRVYADQPATLPELIERAVLAAPDAPAAAEVGGGRVTYAELWERAGRLAGGLQGLGVEPGARVAFVMANSIELLAGVIGAWRAGAVAVTLNTKYTQRELADQLHACAPQVVLAQPEWLSKLHGGRTTDGLAGTLTAPALRPSDPALLMFTSGTTGRSKGALQSHLNVVSAAETWVRCLGLGPDASTVVAAPMFHVTGLNGQSLPVLALGGLVTIMPRFDAVTLVDLLAAGEATFFHAAPTIYALAARAAAGRAATRLRTCVSGGAFVSRALVDAARALAPGVDFRISYGMTETSSPAVLTPPGWIDERPGDAIGVPVPVDDVRVDAEGEIQFRGATVIAGYDRHPEADERSYVDGWLRSGDLGELDEHGFLTVVDRLKDVINRGGEKISSLEVENVLGEHPGVLEAGVVARPDDVYGEVPRAFVVTDGEVAEDELRAHAAARLAKFKVPVEFVFVEELPRNPGGKILKNLLR